jgi:chlorobactene glucosyltransferase
LIGRTYALHSALGHWRTLNIIAGSLDFEVALFLSCLWCAAVVYLVYRAFRQRNVLHKVLPQKAAPTSKRAKIAIIVPARDEAANIEPCLRSLLAQSYPDLSIVVVDDDSSDDTGAIVSDIAWAHSQVILLRAPPLPSGWNGKVNACQAGAAAVPDAEWLCFLDADMRAHPLLLANALKAAIDGKIDCLSLSPRHELLSFAERLMIPCGLYMLSFSQDLAESHRPDSAKLTVTGQFMLMRRAAYDRVGGHAAVYYSICEDYELSALFKRNGYRVALQDGTQVLATRMYTGWHDLWPGIAKNLIHMFGGTAAVVTIAPIALLGAWAAVLLPALDWIGCAHSSTGACVGLAPAIVGSTVAFGLHLAGTAYFRIPLWYGLLFPLGYSLGAVLAFDSLRRTLTGRIVWKGRVYP